MMPSADQQIDALIQRHEGSWQLGYKAFPAVLKRLGLTRGAEIGVAFGGHSEAILQNTEVTTLYAIDSYQHRPEYDDPMNLPQPVFDRLFERTGQRLAAFGDRVIQIRRDSVDAAEQIEDNSLDFVYIDGDHSYAGIRADLEAWFPKVRPGGIIAGHDYGQPAFPGVKAATDRFFSRFGLSVRDEGRGVWWAPRPKTPVSVVIAAPGEHFCDASLYDNLLSAGLKAQDTIYLVHDRQHACDATSRVLSAHPDVIVQAAAHVRGPWHAMDCVLEQIKHPLVFPIDLKTPPAAGAIRVLRDRLCNSGAQAAGFAPGARTNDFGFAELLTTSTPPTTAGQIMLATQAVRQAHNASPQGWAKTSDRLIPWLVLADALAGGGRVALEPLAQAHLDHDWTTDECREAAAALSTHASLVDGSDLIRLTLPSFAGRWLNHLDRRPMRTRANVRPADAQPIYVTPRVIDRVVHKFRRTLRGAA